MAQPMLQYQQLPPEAGQLAAMYQLGTPQNEYKVRVTVWAMIVWVVIGGVLGVIFFGAALTADTTGALLLFLALGLGFVGVALYMILTPVLFSSWRVYICTEGFLYKHGNTIEAFRWEQVEAMWQSVTRHRTNGIYTGTTHKYTVRGKDGRQVIFNDKFGHVEDLGNTLSRQITNYLMPQVVSAYNAGNTITFGPLSISQQGVSNGREALSWSQITAISVNRGIVTVKKEGKWLNWSTIMVARVPNIFVFMALVNYVLKSRQPA
ncbi:MAG: DUF6585 family protein [Ktedonobacteraceae bacterium]